MTDVFLIFGELYPFADVVLLTIMEDQRERVMAVEKRSLILTQRRPQLILALKGRHQ